MNERLVRFEMTFKVRLYQGLVEELAYVHVVGVTAYAVSQELTEIHKHLLFGLFTRSRRL